MRRECRLQIHGGAAMGRLVEDGQGIDAGHSIDTFVSLSGGEQVPMLAGIDEPYWVQGSVGQLAAAVAVRHPYPHTVDDGSLQFR